jgi:phosphate starvation-inducible PhoH-like protein
MNKKPSERKPRTRRKDESLSATSESVISTTPKLTLNQLIHFNEPFKCKNKTQKDLVKSIENNDVTICIGPAGTGKSITSLLTVLTLLKSNNKFQSILLLKSITQLNDEMLPALPGDAMEKMYFQNMSFIDSLIKLIGEKNTGDLINSKYINFGVIGSLRGRDLSNTIVIVDEVQNISKDNLKTILTRLSENAKIILLGDPEQIDIKNKRNSSLTYFVRKVKLNPMTGIGIIEFNEDEIVRHRLTSYFINIFKDEIKQDTNYLTSIRIEPKAKKNKIIKIKDLIFNFFKTSTIFKFGK